MITIQQARKLDPTLQDLSDDQLEEVLVELYALGGLALEVYIKRKENPTVPISR